MRNSRQRLFVLVAAIGGVLGLLGRAWIGARPQTSPTPANAHASISAERIVRFETPDAADATLTAPSATDRGDRCLEELSATDSAQFAALCDVHLLAAEADLDLTTKQWSAFASAVAQAQAVRHHYEAQIATVTEISSGRYRLEIPAYAAAGDELRRQFLAELQTGLGKEAAADVWAQLGRKLEGRFAGFGVSAQTLEVIVDSAHATDEVQVERLARYWNSVDGADRLTTRRETHFPRAEDPTGENWHALLALVGKAS